MLNTASELDGGQFRPTALRARCRRFDISPAKGRPIDTPNYSVHWHWMYNAPHQQRIVVLAQSGASSYGAYELYERLARPLHTGAGRQTETVGVTTQLGLGNNYNNRIVGGSVHHGTHPPRVGRASANRPSFIRQRSCNANAWQPSERLAQPLHTGCRAAVRCGWRSHIVQIRPQQAVLGRHRSSTVRTQMHDCRWL